MLAKLIEKGVYRRASDKFMLGHPNCKPKPGRPLGFNTMVTVFIIYITGLSLSVIFLITECLFKCFRESDKGKEMEKKLQAKWKKRKNSDSD